MNEFSQASLLYHVFQKRDSYVNLCKFCAIERGAFLSQLIFLLASISHLDNCFLSD